MPLPAAKPFAVLAVAGLLVAGCAGEEAPPSVFSSGLLGALGKVRGNPDSRVAVEYGAPARVRELGERYRSLEGYGFGTIVNTAKLVDDAVGVDPGAFDEAILVGQPPRWGAVLWGDYDVDTVNDRLGEMGIERDEQDGATRWTSGADFEIDFDGPFMGVVQTNQFNSIRTAEGAFAYAPAAAGVDWVTDPGDSTLADDERMSGFARCLGDVVAARIEQVGVGVREDGTEVFCLEGEKSGIERALDGDVPSSREPWDELLPGMEVEQDGDLVRVTAPADGDAPVGRALRAMVTGDLRGLG
ncbi:hypothetical protein [Actinophytocola algeriensis]|uniref:Lipoprotein n=1 Tax=Actinophytocola algeriensis TaxID=1768010 RepID=A0A7W7Q936_9PSEU|nr:hypothetical protein [Actinophytocola algeriensis]MBB4908891.1 hypothetical protein [Actinophytocola algeriensis]MBE1474721.1 hypothetical protein [Actinophytocola algeriensis]